MICTSCHSDFDPSTLFVVEDHVKVEGQEKGLDAYVCSQRCQEALSQTPMVLPAPEQSPETIKYKDRNGQIHEIDWTGTEVHEPS